MLAVNSNMTPLFEAQDDFKAIEDSIASKFGIPKEAMVVVGDLRDSHPAKKLDMVNLSLHEAVEKNNIDYEHLIYNKNAPIDEIASLLGKAIRVLQVPLNEDVLDIRVTRILDMIYARLSQQLRTSELSIDMVESLPPDVRKLFSYAIEYFNAMGENFSAAQQIALNPGPFDYATQEITNRFTGQPNNEGDGNNEDNDGAEENRPYTPRTAPTAISLVEYIRIRATEQMTFAQKSGIGNSQVAQQNIKEGIPAKFTQAELTILQQGNFDPLRPYELPEDVRNYIALLSRKFLPGIFRIAFDDLDLMGCLHDTNKTIGGALDKLGIHVDTRYSRAKMNFFGKVVIPTIVMRSMLAHYDPTADYKKTDFTKGEKFLGSEVSNALRDFVDPIDIQLSSNLDGLDYEHLIKLADTGDINSVDLLNTSTHDAKGNPFMYIPDDDGKPSSSNLLTFAAGGANYECPAYKSGDWYVVYVQDREHSEHGWFSFPEPSSMRTDGIFNLHGDGQNFYHDREHCSAGQWCIIHSGMFNTYAKGDYANYQPYAYYLIHKDALSEDVLKASYNSAKYYTTSIGTFFANTDYQNAKQYTIFDDAHMMSRPNRYTFRGGAPADGWKDFAPPNLLKPDDPKNYCFNRTIFVLNLIGKWDTSLTGEEEIKSAVQELSATWFPPMGGEISNKKQGFNSLHAGDPETAAAILSGKSGPHGELLDKIKAGRTLINIGDTEYKVAQSSDDFMTFVPVDTPATDYDTVPSFAFRKDPRTGRWISDSSNPMTPAERNKRTLENIEQEYPSFDFSFSPDSTREVNWFPAAGGSSSKHRVGITWDNMICLNDGTDTVEAGNCNVAHGLLHGKRVTYMDTPDGPNIFVMANRGDRTPIGLVGYARNGRVHFYRVHDIKQSGVALLQDISTGNYRPGYLTGNVKPLNRDDYAGAISITPDGMYYDTIGIDEEEGMEHVVPRNKWGHIGLARMNGRIGEGGDPQLAGTIHWVSGETMEDMPGDSRIEMWCLRKDGTKPPYIGNLNH